MQSIGNAFAGSGVYPVDKSKVKSTKTAPSMIFISKEVDTRLSPTTSSSIKLALRVLEEQILETTSDSATADGLSNPLPDLLTITPAFDEVLKYRDPVPCETSKRGMPLYLTSDQVIQYLAEERKWRLKKPKTLHEKQKGLNVSARKKKGVFNTSVKRQRVEREAQCSARGIGQQRQKGRGRAGPTKTRVTGGSARGRKDKAGGLKTWSRARSVF